jgi:hypothetical protein
MFQVLMGKSRQFRQSLNRQQKQTVINVFEYIKNGNADKLIHLVVTETAATTGTSRATVFKRSAAELFAD